MERITVSGLVLGLLLMLGLVGCQSSSPPLAPPSSSPTTSNPFSGLDTIPYQRPHQRSIADVIVQFGRRAELMLGSYFEGQGMSYPPQRLALLAFKEEHSLEVWASNGGDYRHITSYRVFGASGGPGPKLRQGDKQVPEGLYNIALLNPNSGYHLSLKVDYPNAFDRHFANLEQRYDPGGDIFIHGGHGSSGCLAIGDPSVEELFILVERVGIENVEMVIAPYDFRRRRVAYPAGGPTWTPLLYRDISLALARFPVK